MTRTARRNSGKQPSAPTPWSLLRSRRAYKRHRDSADEGMSTGEEIEEQSVAESDTGAERKGKKGQLKLTRKAKLSGSILKKFFSKLKTRLTSKKARRKVEDLTPLLEEEGSSEEPSGRKKWWKRRLRQSTRRASAGDTSRLLCTEEEEEEEEEGMEGVDGVNESSKRKKMKQRESRRLRRQKRKVCFGCRENGHLVSECPHASETGICFKCGSAEHTINACKATVSEGYFPYAKCFICGEVGHLSRSCPDNPRGLYPKGGGCKVCGSVEHLKAACPQRVREEVESEGLGMSSLVFKNASADAEFMDTTGPDAASRRTRHALKKPRFVTF